MAKVKKLTRDYTPAFDRGLKFHGKGEPLTVTVLCAIPPDTLAAIAEVEGVTISDYDSRDGKRKRISGGGIDASAFVTGLLINYLAERGCGKPVNPREASAIVTRARALHKGRTPNAKAIPAKW